MLAPSVLSGSVPFQLPAISSLLRRWCPREYKAGTPLPKTRAATDEYLSRHLLPLSHASSCVLSLSDSQQGPTPPHCPPFFQSPIDVSTARVASVHSITIQRPSGTGGRRGRKETPSFFLASIPPPASFPRLPLLSPPPAFRVPVRSQSHIPTQPLCSRTRPPHSHSDALCPQPSPPLFYLDHFLSPTHLRITSQSLEQASHHPPCGFETHTHTHTPSPACQISIGLPYTSQISSLATSPPTPAHATVVTSVTPTSHNVGTSGQRRCTAVFIPEGKHPLTSSAPTAPFCRAAVGTSSAREPVRKPLALNPFVHKACLLAPVPRPQSPS